MWLGVDTREKQKVQVQGDVISPVTLEALTSGSIDN
jgi:hypothetical protein